MPASSEFRKFERAGRLTFRYERLVQRKQNFQKITLFGDVVERHGSGKGGRCVQKYLKCPPPDPLVVKLHTRSSAALSRVTP